MCRFEFSCHAETLCKTSGQATPPFIRAQSLAIVTRNFLLTVPLFYSAHAHLSESEDEDIVDEPEHSTS